MNWAELPNTTPDTYTHYAATQQDIEEENKLHDLCFMHEACFKLSASCHILIALQEKTGP